MVSQALPARARSGWVHELNTRHHKTALRVFGAIVVLHWLEHVVQAWQIWVLGWPRPKALGVLGLWYPWLVKTEALHYGYAVLMLIGLFLLRHGFVGRARRWWNLSLGIQFWHHFEHLLLIYQATTDTYFFGGKVPTSTLQVFFPRVELHLFYNTIVTIPMVIAMVLHARPNRQERAEAACDCASHQRQRVAIPA